MRFDILDYQNSDQIRISERILIILSQISLTTLSIDTHFRLDAELEG